MKIHSDFAQVRLSAAGLAFAGEGGQFSVRTARMDYTFLGTEPVEVLRAGELPQLLTWHDRQGHCFFEIVPATPEGE